MKQDGAKKRKGTPKGRAKGSGSSYDAVSQRRLGVATQKSPSDGIESYAACNLDSQRRITGGEFGRKAGGIIRQRRLAIQTQLAFHKEQIRQLEQEERQLKVLHEEFIKAPIAAELIAQPSDEELE